MSHLKERKEKNCLNCNAQVQGKFCHICGQENVETKESAWHLVTHFFQDITHFDGKFFTSLKYLLFKPGYLSREFMVGRRASNLNPVRMYIFTSAIFFLIFFSIFKFDPSKAIQTDIDNGVTKVSKSELQKMNAKSYKAFVDEVIKNDSTLKFAYDSALYFKYLDSVIFDEKKGITFGSGKYKNKTDYEAALVKGKKHNWVERQLMYRQFELNGKYNNNSKVILSVLVDKLMHSLPQILFISLPFFALLLKLLYIRHKNFYYVNHAIFTIHLFVFVFIATLLSFGINKLNEILQSGWLSFLHGLIIVIIFFYNYKAMRNFYQQGRGKTMVKFILLQLINFFIAMFIFVAFFFFSLFKI